MKSELNIDMLFQDLIPNYGFIIPERTITKTEFIHLIMSTVDTISNQKNYLFLRSVRRSDFNYISKLNNKIYFQ